MGNIGSTELIVIFIVLMILFGSKKMPELGKGVGEVIKEFKKALKDKA